MTRGERERLIQGYLSGEMSSAEESDFFIQVALDKELRQDLKAQRTIESAFRKDRESEPSEHTALRSRVAMALAASSASVNTPGRIPASGDGAGIGKQASTAGFLGRLMTKPGRWIIASAVALVLTVGAVMIIPDGPPANAPAQAPGSVKPGLLKNTSPSSATSPATPPMNRSGSAPQGAAGGTGDGAASNNAKSNPPASVSSDGVSLGSAAQAPRRTSQSFDGTEPRGSRPRGSESAASRRSTRTRSGPASGSASTSSNSVDNSGSTQTSDGRSIDSRSKKLGSDSIDAGVTVRLKRPLK